MTYPPPGGENPQYQLQPEPLPPSDPYAQGYNSTPPPGNYYQPQGQPHYTQPPSQPMATPQPNVQPGYPSTPGSVLPPPIPPASQGASLGVILAVIVGLVIVLGVAAVLIIPGMVDDDDPQAGGGGDTSEEASPEESKPAPEPSEATSSAEEEETGADDDFATWGPAVNSDDFDPNTPEGAAITYMQSADSGDDAALQAVVCASPTDAMVWDMEYELEGDGEKYGFLYWGISRVVDGETQAWAGWTWEDTAPASQSDLDSISSYYFTVVEEEGQWKVCDIWQ